MSEEVDVFVYKYYGTKEDMFVIISSSAHYTQYGINLTKLYNEEKSYLFSITDDAFNVEEISDIEDKDALFDKNINKYIKEIFSKESEILDRAKIYDKELEYKLLLESIKEKYGILKE